MPNVLKNSRALYALHSVGCLADVACKPAVGVFIRQATETKTFHLTTDYRSRAAQELIAQQPIVSAAQYHSWCRKNLRHEHMVPTSVILKMLLNEPNLSVEFIAGVLRRYGLRATITKQEDRVLNSAGLARKMPPQFDEAGSPMFQNPCARYMQAGLFDGLVRRTDASWF